MEAVKSDGTICPLNPVQYPSDGGAPEVQRAVIDPGIAFYSREYLLLGAHSSIWGDHIVWLANASSVSRFGICYIVVGLVRNSHQSSRRKI